MARVEKGLTLAAMLIYRNFSYTYPLTPRMMEPFLRKYFPEHFKDAQQVGESLGAFPLASHVDPIAGDHWLLVGDAAEAIDPISGEGLSVALRGAEIAAECLVTGWNAGEY